MWTRRKVSNALAWRWLPGWLVAYFQSDIRVRIVLKYIVGVVGRRVRELELKVAKRGRRRTIPPITFTSVTSSPVFWAQFDAYLMREILYHRILYAL